MIHLDAKGFKPEHLGQVSTFLARILDTMAIKNRYMVQTLDDRPYLERVVLHRDSEHGPGTYLHIIWESDLDRDPHDHPHDFQSQIIYGGYVESRFTRWCETCDNFWTGDVTKCQRCGRTLTCQEVQKSTHVAGFYNTLQAHQLHRLELLTKPTVTLVKRGPKIREWGFMTPDGWQHSKDWIAKNKPNASTEIE